MFAMSPAQPGRPPRAASALWPRAALRTDEDFHAERRVTWLELFFDLVFVVVLSRLAHDLALHVGSSGLTDFVIQFAAVFWAWNAFTYYVERFESGGLENRAFVFSAMAAVAVLAVWTEAGLGTHYTGFAAAYVAHPRRQPGAMGSRRTPRADLSAGRRSLSHRLQAGDGVDRARRRIRARGRDAVIHAASATVRQWSWCRVSRRRAPSQPVRAGRTRHGSAGGTGVGVARQTPRPQVLVRRRNELRRHAATPAHRGVGPLQ